MEITEGLRKDQKLGIYAVILFFAVFVIFAYLIPFLYKPDLRYQRHSYDVFKDKAVTSCVVTNYGRRSAERTLMSVAFLSKILDIQFSSESVGKIGEVTSDQRNAVLELRDIAPKEYVTIIFTVEQPQDEPFDVSLMDISGKSDSVKDIAIPIK